MKVLVFDTETNGLPKGINPSITETHNWPHILQISFILYDDETHNILDIQDHLINVNKDIEISDECTKINGITRSKCNKKGIPITDAIDLFNTAIQKADLVVGHNVSFDKRIIMVECIRQKKAQYFTRFSVRKAEYCTMKTTTELCAIEKINIKTGEKYFKYPNLSELHEKLFGNKPKGTHDSMADILICLRCCEMLRKNIDFVKKGCSKFRELYNLYCL
jgi:DNA polymerase III epsilon subunit-like protein